MVSLGKVLDGDLKLEPGELVADMLALPNPAFDGLQRGVRPLLGDFCDSTPGALAEVRVPCCCCWHCAVAELSRSPTQPKTRLLERAAALVAHTTRTVGQNAGTEPACVWQLRRQWECRVRTPSAPRLQVRPARAVLLATRCQAPDLALFECTALSTTLCSAAELPT